MLVRIHLILRDAPVQRRIRRALEGLDTVVTTVPDDELPSSPPLQTADIVIVREDLMGVEIEAFLSAWQRHPESPALVVLTRSQDPGHRTGLLGRGVAAVLGELDAIPALKAALGEIVGARADYMLLALKAKRSSRHGSLDDFVAASSLMQTFVGTVRKLVPTDTTVLLIGETGVGKERLAHVIHDEGPRAGNAFVAVNCAALPDNLLESELFGHERGAFTDAVRDKRGRFEIAHGGTVFLDEIGEMPLHLQTKLLRVLQEREVERIGAEEAIPIDVRVIAATNRDLKEALQEKKFRPDLYYRLSVMTLNIPPLRQRREDVPHLVQTYVARFAKKFNKGTVSIHQEAMDALVTYDWPGNVRELINVIERALLLTTEPVITLRDLPEEFEALPRRSEALLVVDAASASDGASELKFPPGLLSVPLRAARERILNEFERWYLMSVLARTHGRVGEAANAIGIDPRSLYEKMKRYHIDKREFRPENDAPEEN